MRTLVLSMACALALGAFAQQNTKPVGGTGPMISIDKELLDYGTITQGADGNRQFVVTNTGDQPLIISECKGSCGCTVPKCDNAPIAPGKTSVVNVHYDTERVGPFTKTVTVTSNATNGANKVVNIKGTVEAKAGGDAQPAKATPAPMQPAKAATPAKTTTPKKQ